MEMEKMWKDRIESMEEKIQGRSRQDISYREGKIFSKQFLSNNLKVLAGIRTQEGGENEE